MRTDPYQPDPNRKPKRIPGDPVARNSRSKMRQTESHLKALRSARKKK